MPNPDDYLPREHGLGDKAIDALSCVFENTAGSYKFLWTFAILKEIDTSEEHVIPIEKLSNSMLCESVVPINRFKLNFGFHDRMESHIKKLAKIASVKKDLVQGKFDPQAVNQKLLDRIYAKMTANVPHRWLRPFFTERKIHNPTRAEKVVREALIRFVEESFDTQNPPPYKLTEKTIILHPLWRDYFKRNMKIVWCWALWHWTNYLQARNSNIPAVANKIGFPESRGQWKGEQEFWRGIMEKTPGGIHCVYSGDPLHPWDFHLDHYVPWSFIGHNRSWNVIPATEEANAQKRDSLPHEKYFQPFVEFQHTALTIWNRHFQRRFREITEAYRVDLQLTSEQLTDPNKLKEALIRTIAPLMETAKNNAFESDWLYDRTSKISLLTP